MGSSIYAYAFLKASFGTTVSSPIDAIIPLVKRSLKGKSQHYADQSEIQRDISNLFGISIPQTVIRYTFPKLSQSGILKLDPTTHRYVISDNAGVDADIEELEKKSRAQYQRVLSHLSKHIDMRNSRFYDPAQVIEDWLDNSSLGFLGGLNPATQASRIDFEINRIIQHSITDPDDGHNFLNDLTDIAVGDSIYRGIKELTEYESDDAVAGFRDAEMVFRSRMDGVSAYFDTPFVLRALGYSHAELVSGAKEVLALCRNTGCQICVFEHTVDELKRVFKGEIVKLNQNDDNDSDIAHYAATHLQTAGDLIERSMSLEEEVRNAGFKIVSAPPHVEKDWSLDEKELDSRLRIDLPHQRDVTRNTDVDSLTAIFRLRRGEPKQYLERCEAIFITPQKSIADASVKYFRRVFDERKQRNRVQICMTDVVFATRLWTKLPTNANQLPREQIISHVLANLKPPPDLRKNFINHVQSLVREGQITEDTFTRVKLTRFADEILATDYEIGYSQLTRDEAIDTLNKTLRKLKAIHSRATDKIVDVETEEFRKEINLLRSELSDYAGALEDRDREIVSLRNQFEQVAAEVIFINKTKLRLRNKLNALSLFVSFSILFILLFLSLGKILEVINFRTAMDKLSIYWMGWEQNNLRGEVIEISVNLLLSVLTLFGLSMSGALRPVRNFILTWLMRIFIGEEREQNTEVRTERD